jgi:hypothetical protein
MTASIHFFRRTIAALALLVLYAALSACASAPVQQMSDARQAIRAAQDAGAAQKAPTQLSEAQMALNRAESQLNKRFFRAARRNAEEAHAKAVEAMQVARGEQSAEKK